MHKFHFLGYYCSRNLSFCENNPVYLTGYSSHCELALFLKTTIEATLYLGKGKKGISNWLAWSKASRTKEKSLIGHERGRSAPLPPFDCLLVLNSRVIMNI